MKLDPRIKASWSAVAAFLSKRAPAFSRTITVGVVVVSAALGWLEGNWRFGGVVVLILLALVNLAVDEAVGQNAAQLRSLAADAANDENADEISALLEHAGGVVFDSGAPWAAVLAQPSTEGGWVVLARASSAPYVPSISADQLSGYPRDLGRISLSKNELLGFIVMRDVAETTGKLILGFVDYRTETDFGSTDASAARLLQEIRHVRLVALLERLKMRRIERRQA